MILEVKVKPKSSQERIVPSETGPWTVYLREAPEKGKANESLRRLIAKRFEVPRSSVRIVKGETSKLKWVEVDEKK